MILAGIDEAGYGPLLGPLVVAVNAFRTEASVGVPVAPGRRWPVVPLADCGSLKVSDSKKAYSRAKGLGSLERTVLGFAMHKAGCPSDTGEFLSRWSIEGREEALSLPWYGWQGLGLPVVVSPGEIATSALEVSRALERGGIEYLGAALCVVDAVRYNAIVERIGNKATLLFGRTLILMHKLWREYGAEGVYLTVDRLGGRKRYGGFLDIAFPKAAIKVLWETPRESAYVLVGAGSEMFVRFVVGGEQADPAVALSSMWAKYTRELFMELFNGYWLSRAEGVKSTAGYWVDAQRFVGELVAAQAVTEAEAAQFMMTR
ncbi:MAG: hypothetical protein J7M19_02380 [Planctomycetes bacterium]|nr:hypothetical protein [Planctomycetota bacterium]